MLRPRSLQAATAMPLLTGRSQADSEGRRAPVIDAHVHCFAGRDDPRFAYDPRGTYRPAEPATPEHLLRCMADAGVDHAVVVHPEPYRDDHLYLEHCLGVGKDKLKGTCLFFADRPASLDRMAELVGRHVGKVVAARIHAYAPGRLPRFGRPELRSLWKTAADLRLAVQLHFEPRYAQGFEPLIREFPGMTVVIVHLGRPFQGTPEEYGVVLGRAKLPNTVMKPSAIPPRDQYPHRDIGPVIKDLVGRFGPDRLTHVGGFDSKATGASYRAYRERAAPTWRFSPPRNRKVLGGKAARVSGFAKA